MGQLPLSIQRNRLHISIRFTLTSIEYFRILSLTNSCLIYVVLVPLSVNLSLIYLLLLISIDINTSLNSEYVHFLVEKNIRNEEAHLFYSHCFLVILISVRLSRCFSSKKEEFFLLTEHLLHVRQI